jgi:hypothetical protein
MFQTPPFEERTDHGKSNHFFGTHFSYERDEQHTFKSDTDSEMFFIYRLVPRMSDFLGWLTIFDTTPNSRFLWAPRSVHGRIQHKSAFSGYQSIDMHCIMLPVKFDAGLYILFLRNNQLSQKKRGSKVHSFKKGLIFKRCFQVCFIDCMRL